MKTSWMICGALLILPLFSITGCSAIAVALGLRVRLDKLPVTAISASLVNKRSGATVVALGPGQAAQLVIVATTADGKQYPTVGAGNGKVAFNNYTIAASADGASGSDGFDGTDGSAGTDAAPAPVDPTTGMIGTQGPGGNGGNGGNGTDGSAGGDGSPGSPVQVWVRLSRVAPLALLGIPSAALRLESSTPPLLQVKVAGSGRESLFLVDPQGGTLRVLDNGGAGGPGGHGGRAGRGGSGGNGSPPGNSGLDGQAGSDGLAGAPGRAGTITLSVDPAAQSYLSSITTSNRSGNGIAGPAPTLNVEPVAPLW